MVVQSFWFKKNLMPVPVREAHHLVFDRGAVTWTGSFDLAGIGWRPVQVGPDQIVTIRRRPGNVTIDLWISNFRC